MKPYLFVIGTTLLLSLWNRDHRSELAAEETRSAPEFPSQDKNRWINSPPLKMTNTGENSLRGKVVLLNVWTFM